MIRSSSASYAFMRSSLGSPDVDVLVDKRRKIGEEDMTASIQGG